MSNRDFRAELVALLRELARHAQASDLFTDPERVVQIGRAALLACDLARVEWPRALRALSRVHREEQARLLLEAVELQLGRSGEGRLFTAPTPRPLLESWLERCAAEIERALASRFAVSGDLLACCLCEPKDWPSAAELARAATALGAAASGRLAIARARYAAGRRDAAERGYRGLLARTDAARVRAQAREALGYACERRGLWREALLHLEQAVAHGAGLRAEVSAFGLALRAGDLGCARWAADRLERDAAALPWLSRFAREARLRWEITASERGLPNAGTDPDLLRGLRRGAGRGLSELCDELFPDPPTESS